MKGKWKGGTQHERDWSEHDGINDMQYSWPGIHPSR